MGKDVEVAILFADVVGSTQLYEQLGDVKARQMVGRCLDIMREATEANRGTVIKTMGDEVMSTFPTADDAMNAAKRMQERICDRRRARSRQRPRRDPHRLPLRPRRAGAARHLRLGRAHGQPHDEPGEGQADHHDAGDGAEAIAGVASRHAPDRHCDGARQGRRGRAVRGALATRGSDEHAAHGGPGADQGRSAEALEPALPGPRGDASARAARARRSAAPRTTTSSSRAT